MREVLNLAVDESRSEDDPTILRGESYGQSCDENKKKAGNEKQQQACEQWQLWPVVSILDVSSFEKRAKKTALKA